MHRSGSSTRVSDEYYVGVAREAKASSPPSASRSTPALRLPPDLPTYDPLSGAGKKEALRTRFAESMVHLIPLVLILCAVVLWFFSHPEIGISSSKDGSIITRIENTTIDGYNSLKGGASAAGA
ncbi:uncharacterized protein LOC120262471 isoform X1 [Dioscorea cayenensis subsp. rotundata]|uniref:Uncharacterized protein LOC120262471 isoform X1 n=1 Tax=Dioscorea cayennensis subsp. rotundata TaxID=55577 RepID=A0AB40BIT8_DIOCR|nr:uncharacterized protein LOC120262471 isoform X1 [Dioscorea cayenensis subsp. rotundata]